MKSAVIVFPGSNCDRDIAVTLTKVTGHKPEMIWHRDATLPDGLDLVAVPGGFSYGDYLRSGAMAANSPIISDLKKKAESGVLTLGICNGFQILTECGLLPGALIRNRGLKFICRDVNLSVEQPDSLFTSQYKKSQVIRIPVAHHDGNYLADEDTLQQIEDEGRVAFRYCDENGNATDEANPNGSARNIAGLLSSTKSVLGMMPHPERLADNRLGGQDGVPMFESLLERLS
ncbi:MAG: phosphoribosylformylglycinamidine synthase subunit PurQ [Rhodospirillaceae bacterium]|nr:phosphoribosylformylglycinamidine synthase subunit PurQ [Rhodospirillaceae bacterium]